MITSFIKTIRVLCSWGANGRQSSGKKTRHIEIRYYFITDHVQRKNIRLAYCPTEDMISDFFTKPLQGSQFRKFRAFILNIDHDARPVGLQECVGTSSATRESRVESDDPDDSSVCPAPARHQQHVRMPLWLLVKQHPTAHAHLLGVNVAKQNFVEAID